MNRIFAALALTLAATPFVSADVPQQGAWKPGGKWKIRYTFNRGQQNFEIHDIAAPAPGRAIAVGWVTERDKRKPEGLAVLTRDGGKNWSEVALKELPESVFFLNESTGWMVTAGGLWQTVESGLAWRKISKPKNVSRVFFLDENRGFGIGPLKTFVKTDDGGKNWKDVEEAKAIQTSEQYTTFNWVEFFGKGLGIVTGASIPPRHGELPNWADPSGTSYRRQVPHLSVNLETHDGGKTWKADTAPIMGIVTRWRPAPDRYALALIQFDMGFDYPSEVYGINTGGGKSLRVFREKNRAVKDVGWTADGTRATLVAIEPMGRIPNLPVAGKLHVLESEDLKDWHEMTVDWKAYATNALLAIKGNEAWVGTDTGLVLQLVPE